MMVLANLVFVIGESYGLASTVSRRSGVNTLLLALVASLQSCGRRLEIHCVIEIPRAISLNSARGRSRTFTHIVRERKMLRTCGFRRRMQQALRFRMISVTQFRIFPPSGTFSQSGSHIIAASHLARPPPFYTGLATACGNSPMYCVLCVIYPRVTRLSQLHR